MRRRTVLTSAATLAGSALVAPALAAPADAATTTTDTSATTTTGRHGGGPDWAARAADAWSALQSRLASHDGTGLFHERVPAAADDPVHSYEWPFSQVHVAALDLTRVPRTGGRYRADLRALDAAQQHYWTTAGTTGKPGFASGPVAPYGQGGDLFYDDNEWVGLLDVQAYGLTRDVRALREACAISDLVESGWDTDPSHAAPGGVFWTQATWSTDRNTVSNMPAAELDLRLFQFTRDRKYLDRALKYYRWTNAHLQRPDGLYSDHLSLEGVVEPTVWSYNQGVPVGVNTLLHLVTGQRSYLDEARRIAAASLDHFVGSGLLDEQPPYFNSIWFKNLLLLESFTGGHTYRDAARAYAQSLWADKRDPATGLFVFGTDGSTQTIEQAAVVQVFAVLAWNPADHRLLY